MKQNLMEKTDTNNRNNTLVALILIKLKYSEF